MVRNMNRFMNREGLTVLVALVIIMVAVALNRGRSLAEVSDLTAIVVPLITLFALLSWHRELLSEQATMRRLQTRPQVLVYFGRERNPETDRELLMLVIEHFGGGPALDVQFTFSPPLV